MPPDSIETRRSFRVLLYGLGDPDFLVPRRPPRGIRISAYAVSGCPSFEAYDAVVLPYDAFTEQSPPGHLSGIREGERDRRAKEIELLLASGGMICWLVDRDPLVADWDSACHAEDWVRGNMKDLFQAYPGFRHLYLTGYAMPREFTTVFPNVSPANPIFARWVERYCSARFSLNTIDGQRASSATVLCELGSRAAGIARRCDQGTVLYLPSVATSVGPEALADAMEAAVVPYAAAKSLLVQANDALTTGIIDLLGRCGIATHRHEVFREDFWILDEEGKRSAVCEVKGIKANVGRKEVNDADTHRAENDLPQSFPCILFANTFRTRASSLADKEHQIEPNTREHAVRQNVLIVRTLDLLRLFDRLDTGDLTRDRVLELLTQNCGWLQVAEEGDPRIVQS
jgi:hypothetical protein